LRYFYTQSLLTDVAPLNAEELSMTAPPLASTAPPLNLLADASPKVRPTAIQL
jgi:hypothetical protein